MAGGVRSPESLGRIFRIREGVSPQVRPEFFKPFNRTHVNDAPAANPAQTQTRNAHDVPTSGFGRVDAASVASSPRHGKLLTRFQF